MVCLSASSVNQRSKFTSSFRVGQPANPVTLRLRYLVIHEVCSRPRLDEAGICLHSSRLLIGTPSRNVVNPSNSNPASNANVRLSSPAASPLSDPVTLVPDSPLGWISAI